MNMNIIFFTSMLFVSCSPLQAKPLISGASRQFNSLSKDYNEASRVLPEARIFTIMIDPAGDAKTTGRQLDDSFERGITLQCAQRLQQQLEAKFPAVKVILTRMPGETVHELQNASFANRMAIDLYLSVHFFKEHETVPRFYIYSYALGEDCVIKPIELSFYRYDQAHLLNQKNTQIWGQLFKETLIQSSFNKQFQYQGVFSLPFKPLVGIKAPALACEIGLKNKERWQQCIEPLIEALQAVITQACRAI